MKKIRTLLCIALLASASSVRTQAQEQTQTPPAEPIQVQAQDAYYVVIFGGQRPTFKNPRHSHSFAVFIHTDALNRTEYFTISWLSVDGIVRPYALHPEAGRNWGLQETLQLCCKNNMQVTRWGPYQINCDLWNRAVRQKEWLESGNVLYKPADGGSRDGTISNCIHAISYMAREPGQAVPYVYSAPANWGESGSY